MSGRPCIGIPILSILFLALLGGWLARADRAEVEGRLLDRRYAEAAEGLAGLVEESAGAERERLLYLLGEAPLLAGESEAADDAFARFRRKAWPDLELPFGQVMQSGGAHLSLGEFERAGQLFLAVDEYALHRGEVRSWPP